MIEIDGGFRRLACTCVVGRRDVQQRLAFEDGVARCDHQAVDRTGHRRGDEVFHLHGFDHQHLLAGTHAVAARHIAGDDRALKRRGDEDGAFRQRRRRRAGWRVAVGQGDGGRAVEYAERIARCARAFVGAASGIVAGIELRGGGKNRIEMRFDEIRRDPVGDEVGLVEDGAQHRYVGRNAIDAEIAQRTTAALERVVKIFRRRDDDLGKQGVVTRAGAIARIAERIDTHAGAGGGIERTQGSAARLGIAVWRKRFHVDAQLHRRAARRDAGSIETQFGKLGPAGDTNLGLHQIDAKNFLRHRMLDLQARIGLDEDEAIAVGRHQKFECPKAAIADLRGHDDGGVADRLARCGG